MTKRELNEFRKLLKSKQAHLEQAGITGRETLAIEPSADEFDRIQHVQERDLAIGGLDRNARLLREVRAAISRIDEGRFGICLECEESVTMKRLSALPWAGCCIICQEAADSAVGLSSSVVEQLLVSVD